MSSDVDNTTYFSSMGIDLNSQVIQLWYKYNTHTHSVDFDLGSGWTVLFYYSVLFPGEMILVIVMINLMITGLMYDLNKIEYFVLKYAKFNGVYF